MSEWIPTWLVLGQNDDVGEWINILVFIVLGLFWLIGGLVKNLTPKKDRRQGGKTLSKPSRSSPPARNRTLGRDRETWGQRLARKAEQIQAAAAERAREIERQVQGQPARSTTGPRRVLKPTDRPPAPNEDTAAQPGPEGPTELGPDLAMSLKYPSTARTKDRQPAVTIDLDDPKVLRQAILHYEILGKPLALREPFE